MEGAEGRSLFDESKLSPQRSKHFVSSFNIDDIHNPSPLNINMFENAAENPSFSTTTAFMKTTVVSGGVFTSPLSSSPSRSSVSPALNATSWPSQKPSDLFHMPTATTSASSLTFLG